ncbi:bidirectional hydrogenase complex protein HoxE [Picosynechococcus sp. NKBG042902]|uniref:bidirectional hydrogenase complex protein HoxE n=1 Tax=Picosynechococcus sp. NKBG042902 TaxID=490193 RepID=UPI0004A9FE65|nr:bidirectional hydrogenase complex protein HoxE [Picosynechococcus sp. NKBG042902]
MAISHAVPADKRFRVLEVAMKRNQYRQDTLIEILHKAQEVFGYLEDEVLEYVARGLKLPLSRVYGVATFYHLFSLKPKGKHTCVVCLGTACYVKGSQELLNKIDETLHIKPGETTPDDQISLVTARCIGACGIAPAVVYDDEVCGKQNADQVMARLKQLSEGS